MRGAVRCRTRLPHGGVSLFRGIGPHGNGPRQREQGTGLKVQYVCLDMLYVAEINRHVPNAPGVNSVTPLSTSAGTAVDGRTNMAQPWHRVHRRPRVKIDFDVASGDRNRSSPNLGTFNSFFQSGEYSGRAQLLGASNSIRLEPTLTLAPRRNVSVSTRRGFYWRGSLQDGLYGIPGNLIVPSNGVPGRYEGSRPIAEVAWTLNPHLSVHLNYIFVFNGRFEERSVHATSTERYICPWITNRS